MWMWKSGRRVGPGAANGAAGMVTVVMAVVVAVVVAMAMAMAVVAGALGVVRWGCKGRWVGVVACQCRLVFGAALRVRG